MSRFDITEEELEGLPPELIAQLSLKRRRSAPDRKVKRPKTDFIDLRGMLRGIEPTPRR